MGWLLQHNEGDCCLIAPDPHSTATRVDTGWQNRVSLTLQLLAMFAVVLSGELADPDLWGHVAYGKAAWEQGAPLAANTYSFICPEHRWVNHEWLFEVLLHLFNWSSGRGLVLLHALGLALMTGAVLLNLRRAQAGGPVTTALVLLVLLPQVGLGRYLRPHLASFALAAVFTHLLQTAEDTGQYRRLFWWLPPLCALWANLHGGFLVGLSLVGLYTAKALATGGRGRLRLLALPALGAAATLATPYGTELFTWLWSSLGEPRPHITEWWPAFHYWKDPEIQLFFGLFLASLLLLVHRPALLRRTAVLAFLAVSAFALRHVRHVSFAFLLWPMAFGPACHAWFDRCFTTPRGRRGLGRFCDLVAVLLLAAGTVRLARTGARVEVRRGENAIAVVRFMQANRLQGRLVARFDWSQYCIWHLWPACAIAVDGRYRTAYPNDLLEAFIAFQKDEPPPPPFPSRYKADFALFRVDDGACRTLARAPDWEVLYSNGGALLFVRTTARTEHVRARREAGLLHRPRVEQQPFWP